jgi:hypothetical protein
VTHRALALTIGLALLAAGASCDRVQDGSSAGVVPTCSLQTDPALDGRQGDVLVAISGSTPGAMWAVGSHYAGLKETAIAFRWSGSTWTTTPVAIAGRSANALRLEDVSASGASDVWAVGYDHRGTAAIHWNGTSWTDVGTPPIPGGVNGDLLGVAAAGPRSAWAVGQALVHRTMSAVIERWDGSRWSLVAAPRPPGQSSSLKDIATGTGGATWAVGWYVTDDGTYRPLAERWQGSRWEIVAAPHGRGQTTLSAVSVVGPSSAWAVGWSWVGRRSTSLVLHWNGTGWTRSHLPGPNGAQARVAHVAPARGGVAVVGEVADPHGIMRPVAFVKRGTAWTELGVQGADMGGNLLGVTSMGVQGLMSVGEAQATRNYASLVVHGC